MADSTSIEQPFPIFFDKVGKPLDSGYVYIGEYGKNPQTNPIQTFWDEALTQPAVQPIRTINGYYSRYGTSSRVFIQGISCSITVRDKYQTVVYSELKTSGKVAGLINASVILDDSGQNQQQINDKSITAVNSIADLIAIPNPKNGQVVYVKSYHVGLNRGGRKVTYDSSKSGINDGVFIFNGWVSDPILNLSPDHAGAKPNDSSFDNTDAINKVFATGQDIYGKPDDVYHVTKSIRTKGQKTFGGWKINSTKATGRTGTWSKLVTTSDTGLDTSNNIRMLYVASSWDLSEFLAIKELGFNTIHHYVGMGQMGWDWDGDVFDALNNAMTAGLKVSLGTEQDPNAISDLAAWVASVDNYPAVWAYSVYDEPVARGFSIAQQDEKIDLLRTLTSKNLTLVDYESNVFEQKYSTKYDIVFVNSYSKIWNNEYSYFSQDLDKMRRDYGVLKAQIKSRTIPCVSAFTFSGNLYAHDVDQVVAASTIFGTVANGDFAAFVWDGEADAEITAAVRDNTKLQNLVKGLCESTRGIKHEMDVYLFGGTNLQTQWGLNEVLRKLQVPDVSTESPMTINSYPIKINYNPEVDDDRNSTTSGYAFAGIGFKGGTARIVTNIKLRKYLKLVLEYVNVDNDVPSSTFEFCSTEDGYTLKSEYIKAVESTNINIETSVLVSNPNNTHLAIRFKNESAIIKSKYRQLLRGIIISSDW